MCASARLQRGKKKEKTIKLALAMALGRRSSGAFAGLDPHSACFVAAGRGRPEGTSGRPCEASEAGPEVMWALAL